MSGRIDTLLKNRNTLFWTLQIGGWLPNHSSMLIDLTVGPAITF